MTDLRTMRVGMVAPAVMNVPLWVADEAGEFASRGIRLETQIIGSTEGTTNALRDGAIDVAFGSPDPALVDPQMVSVLAGLVDRPPLSLVCRPGIGTYEDLRGRTFGTTSLREGTVQIIQAMLAPKGLFYPADYSFVMAGAHPQRWQALQHGRIDAALQLMPFDYLAEQAGYPVLDRAEDIVPDFAFSSVCITTAFHAANADLVDAFHAALIAGEHIVRTDARATAASIATHARVDEANALRCVHRLVDGGVMPAGLTHSAAALDRTRQAIADGAATAGATLRSVMT